MVEGIQENSHGIRCTVEPEFLSFITKMAHVDKHWPRINDDGKFPILIGAASAPGSFNADVDPGYGNTCFLVQYFPFELETLVLSCYTRSITNQDDNDQKESKMSFLGDMDSW